MDELKSLGLGLVVWSGIAVVVVGIVKLFGPMSISILGAIVIVLIIAWVTGESIRY